MLNTIRKSESITVDKQIRGKFRSIDYVILHEKARNMRLNPQVCNGCKKIFSESLQLDHGRRSFDDLVDETCIKFNVKNTNDLDLRTTRGKSIKDYYENILNRDVTPQYLYKKCHEKKTNNERIYNGGRKLTHQ